MENEDVVSTSLPTSFTPHLISFTSCLLNNPYVELIWPWIPMCSMQTSRPLEIWDFSEFIVFHIKKNGFILWSWEKGSNTEGLMRWGSYTCDLRFVLMKWISEWGVYKCCMVVKLRIFFYLKETFVDIFLFLCIFISNIELWLKKL